MLGELGGLIVMLKSVLMEQGHWSRGLVTWQSFNY